MRIKTIHSRPGYALVARKQGRFISMGWRYTPLCIEKFTPAQARKLFMAGLQMCDELQAEAKGATP